ncbi:MAG: hypothetical protein MUE73_15885 [Planctomycetes bacterium]|nr:hypothetical protein [Planctomycetota bacterium]
MGLAAEEVRLKAPGDPVTLLLAAERPRVLAGREVRADAVLGALAAARPALVTDGFEAAVPALRAVVAEGGRAVAIGVGPSVPEGIVVREAGGANAGITAFAVRVDGGEVRALVRTAGAGAGAEIVARLGGEEVRAPAAREIDLRLPRGGGGVLRVSLQPPVGPSFDDSVEAWVAPAPSLRIGVAEEGGADPFLAAALGAAGEIVDRSGSGVFPLGRLSEAAGGFDVLVIAEGSVPDGLPRGDFLLLTPPPESLGFRPLPAAESAPVFEVGGFHPVTRGVDAAEVQALGATPGALPPEAVPLLTLPGGAAAAAGEREGVRYVWIGLVPENSTLAVTGAFPLLVRNALEWFRALRTGPLPPCAALGEPLAPAVVLAPSLRAVLCEGPGPEERAVVVVENGTFAFLAHSSVEGEVAVRIGDTVHRTWFNAILPGETEAAPGPDREQPPEDRRRHRDTERRFWPALVAAAVAFLLLEWLVVRG